MYQERLYQRSLTVHSRQSNKNKFFFLDLNKSRSVVWPGSFLSLAPMLAVRLIKRKTISCWWWIECYILSCSSDVLH
jgi:hypothetical protein